MSLRTIVYLSSATTDFGQAELTELLRVAVSKNQQRQITGLLMYKDGAFLQVLEGEDEDVSETFARIQRDKRHKGLITLLDKPIETRSFSNWSMGFKNMNQLSDEDKIHCNEYLDLSLSDPVFTEHPNFAMRVLLTFRNTTR